MTVRPTACRYCLTPIEQKRFGRPRLFCSQSCTDGWHYEERRGFHKTKFHYGTLAKLDPEEIEELHRRRREGWTKPQLARTYGVSVRTVERYLTRGLPTAIRFGEWVAYFQPRKKGPPSQVTGWRRAA